MNRNGYRNSVTPPQLNHAVACQILTCHCLCSVDLLPHTSAVDPVFYPAFRDNKPDGSSCPMPIFSAPVKCQTIRIAFVQLKYGQKSIFFIRFVYLQMKWPFTHSLWLVLGGVRGECKNHCQRTRQKQKRNKQAKEREAKKAHKIYKTYNMVHTQHMKHTKSKTKKKNNPETQVSRTQWLKHFIFNIGLQWLLNESIVYQAIRYGSVCVKMSNLKRQSIHSMVVAAVYSIQLQFIFMFHTHFSYFSLPICVCVLEFVHVFIIFNRKTISNRRFTTQENGVK